MLVNHQEFISIESGSHQVELEKNMYINLTMGRVTEDHVSS
jgi:hypothetical protein